MSNAATTLFQEEIDVWNGVARQEGKSRNEIFRAALLDFAERFYPAVAEQVKAIRDNAGSFGLFVLFCASLCMGLDVRRAPSRIKLVTVRAPIVRRAKEVEA